jgi:hypothetical protein
LAEVSRSTSSITATGAVSVARGQHVEQLHQLRVVKQAGVGQSAVRKAAMLRQRDQLFNVGAQFARLGQGRGDLLMLDQRGSHVAEQGLAVAGGAVELAAAVLVTHRSFLRS